MSQTTTIAVSDELLRKFTAHSALEVRLYMHTPWRHQGRIFATNGHVLIAIDDNGRDGVSPHEPGRHPKIELILKHEYPDSAFAPLPDIGGITKPCVRCHGAGFHFEIDCDDCDGRGAFDHGKHTYTCVECNGGGTVGSKTERTRCETCAGFGESGWWQECDKTDIGDARFQTRYLRLFAGLPNVRIATGGPNDKAIIRFDGGMGVVMPMRKTP